LIVERVNVSARAFTGISAKTLPSILSISFPENVDFHHATEEVILSLEPEKE